MKSLNKFAESSLFWIYSARLRLIIEQTNNYHDDITWSTAN